MVHVLRHGVSIGRIRDTETAKYPTDLKAFQTYRKDSNWQSFKDDIYDDIRTRKNRNKVSFRDSTDIVKLPPWTRKQAPVVVRPNNHSVRIPSRRLNPVFPVG